MTEVLQAWIDRLYATSGQQWVLRVISVITAVGAACGTALVSGRWWGFGVFVVAVLSIASALRPDLHTGTVIVVVLWWTWIGTVPDVLSPWVLVAAVDVLVFHATTALMATVPPAATIPRSVVLRWGGRTGVVAAATVVVWLVAVAVDSQAWRGNAVLTGAALAVLVAAAATVRRRSLVRG